MTQTAPPASRADIAAELERVKAEIGAYPGPIAGCDAQFNHLLERRRALVAALAAPEAQRDQTAPGT